MTSRGKLSSKDTNDFTNEINLQKTQQITRSTGKKINTTINANAYPFLASQAEGSDQKSKNEKVGRASNADEEEESPAFRRRSNVLDTASLLSSLPFKADKNTIWTSLQEEKANDKEINQIKSSSLTKSFNEKPNNGSSIEKKTSSNADSNSRDYPERRTAITPADSKDILPYRRVTVNERSDSRPVLFENRRLSPDLKTTTEKGQKTSSKQLKEASAKNNGVGKSQEENKETIQISPELRQSSPLPSSPTSESSKLHSLQNEHVSSNKKSQNTFGNTENSEKSIQMIAEEQNKQNKINEGVGQARYQFNSEQNDFEMAIEEVNIQKNEQEAEQGLQKEEDKERPMSVDTTHENTGHDEQSLSGKQRSHNPVQLTTGLPHCAEKKLVRNPKDQTSDDESVSVRSTRIRTVFGDRELKKESKLEEDHPLSRKRYLSPPSRVSNSDMNLKATINGDDTEQEITNESKERSRVLGFDNKETMQLFNRKLPEDMDDYNFKKDRSYMIDDRLKVKIKGHRIEHIFKSEKFREILRNVDVTKAFSSKLPKNDSIESNQEKKAEENKAEELEEIFDYEVYENRIKSSPSPSMTPKFRQAVQDGTKSQPEPQTKEAVANVPSSEQLQAESTQQIPKSKVEYISVQTENNSLSEIRSMASMVQGTHKKKFKCLLAKRGQQLAIQQLKNSVKYEHGSSNISSMTRSNSLSVRKDANALSASSVSIIGTKDQLRTLEEHEQAVMSYVPPEKCERCLRISSDPKKESYELELQESELLEPLSSFFYFTIGNEMKNTSLGQPRAIEIDLQGILYIGTSKGVILMHDANFESLEKLGKAQFHQNGGISALKLFEDQTYLLAGHDTGCIVVWNLKKQVPFKRIFFMSNPILALDTLGSDPLSFIAANSEGRMSSFSITKGFLGGYDIKETVLLTRAAGPIIDVNTVFIKDLYAKSEDTLPPALLSSGNSAQGFLAAIVSTSRVAVVSFNPTPKVLQAISYDLNSEVYLPYTCWGEIHRGGQEIVCLLAAYGLALEILEFSIEEEITCKIKYHIDLESPPVCVEFLKPNLFAVIDSTNMLQIIHFDDFQEGSYREKIRNSSRRSSSSRRSYYRDQLEGEIFPRSFVSYESQQLSLFHRSILYNHNTSTFYQICEKGISSTKLYNEIEFLEAIFHKGDYRKFLTVTYELINGNIKEIYPGVRLGSSDLRFRMDAKLYKYITQKLLSCIYNQLIKGNEDKENYTPNPKLVRRTVREIIDFCLQVNMLEFLYTKIIQSFELMKLTEEFYRGLEPFVLLNRIQWMPDAQLREFITHLKTNGKMMTLQRLFLGFSIKQFDIDDLMSICIQEKLTFPLIYICTRGDNDYITPLKKLMEPVANNESSDLAAERVQKDCLNALWYIRKCLQNRRLFSRLPIQSETWIEITYEIAALILAQVKHFIYNCSYEFIPICLLLFQGKVADQLKGLTLKDMRSVPEEDNYSLTDSVLVRIFCKIKGILENIISSGSQLEMHQRQQKAAACLYFFLAALAELQIWRMLPTNLILQCVKELLDQPELISYELMLFYYKAQRPIRTDMEECSRNVEKVVEQEVDDDFYITRKDQLVVSLVKYCSDSLKNDRKKLDELEKIADTSPYSSVRSYLNYLKGDIKRSLDVFTFRSVPQKIKINVFSWADYLLSEHKAPDSNSLLAIRDLILDKISDFLNISTKHTKQLIEKYFNGQKIKIVKSLEKSPELQLKYLEEELVENQTDSGKFSHYDECAEEIELYVKLLCQSDDKGQKKKMIEKLKKYESYYKLEEILAIFEKKNNKQGEAYIQEVIGNVDKAIKLRLEIFDGLLKKYIDGRKEITQKRKNKLAEITKGIIDTLNALKYDQDELEESWKVFITELANCILSQNLTTFSSQQLQEDSYQRLVQELFNSVILESFNRVPYEKVLQLVRTFPIKDLKLVIYDYIINVAFNVTTYKDAKTSLMNSFYQIENDSVSSSSIGTWVRGKIHLIETAPNVFQTICTAENSEVEKSRNWLRNITMESDFKFMDHHHDEIDNAVAGANPSAASIKTTIEEESTMVRMVGSSKKASRLHALDWHDRRVLDYTREMKQLLSKIGN